MIKEKLSVVLAGNPNSGKTSVFNMLTGARHTIGNYPGITVDRKTGSFNWNGRSVNVTDLPGTYSLTPGSPEELIARTVIMNENPDIVINVIDASNLERNLYLTMQLMELGVRMIVVLNMWDVAEKIGLGIDSEKLESILSVPVVKTTGSRGRGSAELKDSITASEMIPTVTPWLSNCPEELQRAVKKLSAKAENRERNHSVWRAVKLLEGDASVESNEEPDLLDAAHALAGFLEEKLGVSGEMLIAGERYRFIENIIAGVVTRSGRERETFSDRLDSVLTHRHFGIPVFLVMMYLVFSFTFILAEPLMGFLEHFFQFLGETVSALWPVGSESMLRDLIVEGIIGGVGGVLVFLPNIFLLFLAISVLEDSGYMARVAFIMDGAMRKAGLQGKSFVPLIIGFGCTVPAILATRTLENRNDRLTTIMVAPLMSCGARLPIYMMIIPAFFPEVWRAPLVWIIYMTGIIVSVGIARFLRKRVFTGEETHFILELPSYHMPTPVSVFRHTWDRAGEYVKKAGTLILAISVILWVFSSFPEKKRFSVDYDGEIAALESSNLPEAVISDSISNLESSRRREEFMYTITGRLGRTIEPIMRPLGFDWRVTTALLGAVAAKEAFVSQLGVVFAVGAEAEENSATLREKLRENYTPLQGIAMMLFALISAPCLATIAVTRKETGSWKWAMVQLFGLTALAYSVTFIVYQTGKLVM